MKRPRSGNYRQLKELVLSSDFPWYSQGPIPPDTYRFYSHIIVERPEFGQRIPKVTSPHFTLAHDVFLELCAEQDETVNSILRMAVNCVEPLPNTPHECIPHVDHDFPHRQMVAYFTDTGGATVVEGEPFIPEEDDVLFFTGRHTHQFPEQDRRVVLVATFI